MGVSQTAPRGIFARARASATLDVAKRTWGGLKTARTLGLAAEVAFWLFLSLVPIAAVGGFVAARFALRRNDLLAHALAALPAPVTHLLEGQLARVASWNAGTVAPVAAVVFLWLASSGIQSIFDALEVQVHVERPWWKKRLIALATCVLLSVGVAALAFVATGIGWIQRLFGNGAIGAALLRIEWSPFGSALRLGVGAVVAFGLLCLLYWIGTPKPARRRMPITPGALLAVVLELAMGFGYGFYLSKAGTGDAYQAGLAVVGVTLMTLYLFSLALLAGAELNQVLAERRAAR